MMDSGSAALRGLAGMTAVPSRTGKLLPNDAAREKQLGEIAGRDFTDRALALQP